MHSTSGEPGGRLDSTGASCCRDRRTIPLDVRSFMALQCRLLHDITKVDHALNFWAARLKAGQHRSFLLLGQGPTSFVLDILAVLSRKTDRHNHLSATDQIERRVSILMFLASPRC